MKNLIVFHVEEYFLKKGKKRGGEIRLMKIKINEIKLISFEEGRKKSGNEKKE